MAAHAPTTFGGAAPPDPFHGGSPSFGATPSPLSIAALGFELMAVKQRVRQIADADESRKPAMGRDDLYCTLRDREEALEAVIATMRAENLVEATIQIALAGKIADEVDRGDFRAPETHDFRDELHRALRRITLSVLPVLAAAAGLDEKAMGWDEDADLRERYFHTGTAAVADAAVLPAAFALSPDSQLVALGARFDAAQTEERAAWKAAEVADGDDDAPERLRARKLNRVTGAVVDEIEEMSATTLAGILVKVRAIVWCRSGEPLEIEDFASPIKDASTDRRLLVGMMSNLSMMAGSAVA